MAYKRLQIKQLSPRGELLRCVNCPAGRITVFRAASGTDLSQFQRALAGVPGPERFSLTIDNEPFEQSQHFFVGFGEHFNGADSFTVSEYLAKAGVPESQIHSTLISFELEQHERAPCSSLGPDQERRLRLLAGLQSTRWALILNEPFEDLSSRWKERFAELLTSYAARQGGIVVIPSLSYRPGSWIDNEVINRVQVGENLQKTIGFQSGASDVNDLIKQLRESVGAEALSSLSLEPKEEASPAPSEGTGARLAAKENQISEQTIESSVYNDSRAYHARNQSLNSHHKLAFGVTAFLVLLVASTALFLYSGDKPTGDLALSTVTGDPLTAESREPSGFTEKSLEGSSLQIDEKEALEANVDAAGSALELEATKTNEENLALPQKENLGNTLAQTPVVESRSVPPPQPSEPPSFIDSYPPEVRRAVLRAFDVGDDWNRGSRVARQKRETNDQKELAGDNLFRLLEQTSGSGDNIPSAPPPRAPNRNFGTGASRGISSADLEKRRELIRQKFLEAIERSSQRN